MIDRPAATDRPQLYRAAFDRYVASTDGKEKLAREIAEIARSMKAARLLDLGAGNGVLTRLVSPHFQAIVAVEQNRAFGASLAVIPNAVPVIARIEDHVPVEPPDLVLMSYSLDGIPDERLGATMTTLGLVPRAPREGHLRDSRRRLPLGSLRRPRLPCARRPPDRRREAARRRPPARGLPGAAPRLRRGAHVGRGQGSPVRGLDFFFIEAIDGYRASRPEFEEILAGLVETLPDGRVALRAVECVFEIVYSQS